MGMRLPALLLALTTVSAAAGQQPPSGPALVERDWRMRDGIGTKREPSTWEEAIGRTLRGGDKLACFLEANGVETGELAMRWDALWREWRRRTAAPTTTQAQWEDLWRRVHGLRRRIVFANPLAQTGPLLFVKRVPSAFSHQLTQYLGRDARPGGGLFVLEEPGRSMRCRQLAAELPAGSYLLPDVSFDGQRVVFAFCKVDEPPRNRDDHADVFYHLYEVGADGSGLRQLTDGPHDDFAPRYLPSGKLIFLSTRRGGFHRCGRGPCPTHTLALCEADGGRPEAASQSAQGADCPRQPGCRNVRTLSWHETHEWDPCVLNDGRVVYTRWDYVDRHAVHYQQLWSCRPDGSLAAAFYGNNTLSPVGTWEARPVPGSSRVMATAAAHHAMTAGSIILLDVARGIDGPAPIARLTPDALFPESEAPVIRQTGGHWHAPVGVPKKPAVPVEQRRWPGHCYRSPWPLSETLFLAAYSYQPLIGEPTANHREMFGLYLCDAFGSRELLYRDPAISSLWPMPLRPRPRPPTVPSTSGAAPRTQGSSSLRSGVGTPTPPLLRHGQQGTPRQRTAAERRPSRPPAERRDERVAGRSGRDERVAGQGGRDERAGGQGTRGGEGTLLLLNVYESFPPLPAGSVRRLRIVQVLPKTTPHINSPRVGLANASPGKQVLGTVPVEADGSAHFRAPAGKALAFQALDGRGQAVQVMRSIVYLQPGETASCIGCHEPRSQAPPVQPTAKALFRPPSAIAPGPDGSKPLSYPLLVQPVLDKHCVRCHGGAKPKKGIVLTGKPAGQFSCSYNALAPRVPYSAWGGRRGDFRKVNSEPLSRPGFFGARGSPLMRMLLKGHNKVELSPSDLERLVTWMDANALFYGTFDPADQARQRRGERIRGPAVE